MSRPWMALLYVTLKYSHINVDFLRRIECSGTLIHRRKKTLTKSIFIYIHSKLYLLLFIYIQDS